MASDESEENEIYCICRQPYDETQFMIECDVCKEWFHGSCVGVQEHQASDIEIYHCPNCQLTRGPLQLKKRLNWHRHDYSEPENNSAKVQTGTRVFIQELKSRHFPSADELPIIRVPGSALTTENFHKHGFNNPIMVEKKDGLGLTVPPSNFTIQDVENHVGSMREIDVIDVSKQEDYKMLMREWTEYYNSPNREKIFNVISLEFSNTSLAELVVPPSIVREASWLTNGVWPEQLPDDCPYSRPDVQRYCLMGVRDSFTDFHIDFGGSSVWYHVLRGEKVFYFVKPTTANLTLYESWLSSTNQSETFFGDQVDKCYKCRVKQGQTVFIPTGWIHAVFTPIDSLVFGGNFLHSYNIPMQLETYAIERRVKTPEKYLFPCYETINWYAAKHVLDGLKEYVEDGKKPPPYLLQGGKALAYHLKTWTQRKDFIKDAKHEVPEYIQYGKLLKDLNKDVKTLEELHKSSSGKTRSEKKKKKKNSLPPPKQMESIDLLHQHTQDKLHQMEMEQKKNVYNFQDDDEEDPPSSSSSKLLKVRIPKAGAYFDPSVKQELDSPDKKEMKGSLKLKVSNGKIVSDSVKKGAKLGEFQPLVAPEEGDSDAEDSLVVDENPKPKRKEPLKLKLSINAKPSIESTLIKSESSAESSGFTESQSELSADSQPESSPRSQTKAAGVKKQEPAIDPSDTLSVEQTLRMNIPTIRGGLNGSIADILEASGYGTETAFTVDDEVGRASSPSMRDAIQGMLSMSRMGGMQLFSRSESRRNAIRHKSPMAIEDEEDHLAKCYQDEEFVYPTLEVSDEEAEQMFRSRGKPHKDESWNPKARVNIAVPLGERQHRDGARKESIEKSLADTAAKLANAPKVKRPYKKKIKPDKDQNMEPQPGTSSASCLSPTYSGSAFRPGLKRAGSDSGTGTSDWSPTKVAAKKPRKGQATAKQRLGKILKIHKMGLF